MKKTLLSTVVAFSPMLAFAAADTNLSNFQSLANAIGNIVDTLIPIAFSLGLLFFFWGLAKFILSAGEAKDEGKNMMIWGVVALFVMASVWGIVNFIRGTLGVDNTNTVSVPTIR